jgi:PAS domain S-box-containing protein
MLTGQEDHEIDIEAMMSGAADYLIKNQLNPSLLERSIRYAIEWKHSEERFKKLNADLERRVRERTSQLQDTNNELSKEISTRKRVEQSLRKNKERLELAQKAGNIGSFEWDIEKNVFRWSEELKKLYGLDFKGHNTSYEEWISKVHPVDASKVQFELQRAQSERKELAIEYRIRWPDKGIRWIASRAQFFYAGDKAVSMVGINRDITSRIQAENSLRFLAEVGTELTTSLDYQTTLDTITKLAVPSLADWCVVDILENEGNIRRLSVAHTDPQKKDQINELNKKYPSSISSAEGIGKVIRTGKSQIYTDISDELLKAIASNENRYKGLKEIGFHSCMIVPLMRKGVCLGTIKFVLADGNRKYLNSDLTVAEDLAYKAAVAVENAQFYKAELTSKKEAQAAERRTRSLQSLTAALSESLTLEQVAKVSMDEGLKVLGGCSGCLGLVNQEEKTIEIISLFGYGKDEVEEWEKFPIDSKTPLSTAVKTKKLLILQNRAKRNKKYPHLSQAQEQIGKETLVAIPLILKGKALGAFGLHFDKLMRFSREEKALMQAVGQQCAQALDRARLYESELQARETAEKAQKELAQSEERYRFLAESIPQIVWTADKEGQVDYFNSKWTEFTGLSLDDVGNSGLKPIIHPDHIEKCKRLWHESLKTGKVFKIEYLLRKSDGSYRWHLGKAIPLKNSKGKIIKWFGTSTNIHRQKKSAETLKKSLHEKEVLLKEIHHRVKNNLQIISSLLNLQSRKIQDQKYLEIFKESQNRVRSMSLVHEKLYQSQDLANIDFGQYVNNIASNLFRSYSIQSGAVRLKINTCETILLSVDTATPCGLIINELLSNSLKYAFPGKKEGTITINLGYNDQTMSIEVVDNGIGLPKDFDLTKTDSLGLKLITTLTDQINGKFILEGENGTKARIEFPFVKNNDI